MNLTTNELYGLSLTKMHTYVDLLEDQHSSSNREFELLRKIKKARKNLRNFQGIVENLPPDFELFVRTGTQINSVQKETNKRAFRRMRGAHLSSKAIECKTQFLKMGLSESHIARIVKTGRSPILGKSHYDITVDHLDDLKYGGQNIPENFKIVPRYVNELRAYFQVLQGEDKKTPCRLDLRYTSEDDVPYFKDGFRKSQPKLHKARMSSLLGFQLK